MTEGRREEAAGEGLFVPVRRVGLGEPLRWLAAGARDLRRAPRVGFFYGAAFAAMGWAVVLVFRGAPEYAYALTAGFLLVGPFVATGLYDASRRLARGERVRLADTLLAWRANTGAFAVFGLVLLVLLLLWSRISLVIFAVFFASGVPRIDQLLARLLSLEHWDFLLAWAAAGFVFAALVYAASVVSVPMMLDRGTDAIVAALTSVRALAANPGALALWAACIVALVGIGFATAFVGLLVTAPLVGHATWHAYRAIVGESPPR